MPILAMLPSLIAAGKDIYKMVSEIRTAAKQSGEWTDAHEAEFQSLLDTAAKAPHWQPQG
jgi:hypothetical protein